MTARAVLRAATADAHERVDRLFSTLDLADIGQYRLFLRAQAAAHLPVEAALETGRLGEVLDHWPERRRSHLLVEDLAALGTDLPNPIAAPALPDIPAKLGAVYVLEGSRLGGALLRRTLPGHAPTHFLGAAQSPGAWRKLLATLDEHLSGPAQLDAAVGAAREVFMRFEVSGRRLFAPVTS